MGPVAVGGDMGAYDNAFRYPHPAPETGKNRSRGDRPRALRVSGADGDTAGDPCPSDDGAIEECDDDGEEHAGGFDEASVPLSDAFELSTPASPVFPVPLEVGWAGVLS